ncbi:MAG: DUF3021 family protein [Ruminococcus sp.]
MDKIRRFFSLLVNSFTWQVLILAAVNLFFGKGINFTAVSVLQCFAVALAISLLMLITDIVLTDLFKLKLSLPVISVIDIAEVFLVVLILGGLVFGWFDFVLTDLLIAAGVIAAVFVIVFATQIFRMKADSAAINKILRERNGNEKSN